MPAKVNQWSFSTWKTAKTCMLKLKYNKIDGLPYGSSIAMERGTQVHENAEHHIKSDQLLTGPLISWKKEFKDLAKKVNASDNWEAEGKLAFTKGWVPVSFFHTTAWLRMVLDVYYTKKLTSTVIDYKTGQIYPDHDDQAELYALGMLTKFHHLESVTVQFWYVDQDEIVEDKFYRSAMGELRDRWEEEGNDITQATEFEPTPGSHCRWCAYAKSKGGPCPY